MPVRGWREIQSWLQPLRAERQGTLGKDCREEGMQSSWKTLKRAHSVGSGLAARAGGSLSLGAEGHGFGDVGAASPAQS